MATVNPPKPKPIEHLAWYTSRGPHSVWDRFTAEQQEQMLTDDLQAGTRVSLVLTALITAGMVLSIVTVLAVVLLQ